MAFQRGSHGDSMVYLEDADGVVLNGVAKSATFDTAWYNMGACDWFGLAWVHTVTGTSPTWDLDVEWTADSSASTVVAHDYPDAANSQTGAASAQITATGNAVPEYWRNINPLRSTALTPAIRAEVTIGGTSPSFTTTGYLIRVYRGA